MTDAEPLATVFERLAGSSSDAALFDADEISTWPRGAIDALVSCGMLQRAEPARVVECGGCERNCFKHVEMRVASAHRSAHAFISCDEPEDMGRISVELNRLERFQITDSTLAAVVARLVGATKLMDEGGLDRCWELQLPIREGFSIEVELSIARNVTLRAAEQTLPLIHALALTEGVLRTDERAMARFAQAAEVHLSPETGSIEWRKTTASRAANARHDRPGGSRDKQRQIREIWDSGKYSSRDLCAEQECAALGMSISSARKALRNTPPPSRC